MKNHNKYFRKSFLAAAVAGFCSISHSTEAMEYTGAQPENPLSEVIPDPGTGDVEFISDVLMLQNNQPVDISRFSKRGFLLPGKYYASIRVNGSEVGNENIEIKTRADNSGYVCITPELLKAIPLAWERINETDTVRQPNSDGCTEILSGIPNARVEFDAGEQVLDITLPQKYVHRSARGFVNPELWDSGIPAAFLSYGLNAWTSQSSHYDYKSLFASLNTGFNLGAWYFRHNGSYSWSDDGKKDYQSLNSYAQRDIPFIKGRLLVGQSNTTGRVFDSLPFSGMQIASDERMYPASLRGYAPEIRGMARTNAKVTVRQNSAIIYETTVSPGEFVINDLYPTGFGGDLTVTVREADGNENFFLVPYTAMPQLIRPGSYRYSFTAGKLRQLNLRDKPEFYEATWQHGLTNYLTGYTGWQQSDGYYAAQAGMALGTQAGAISLDITKSHASFAGNPNGQEYSHKTSSGQSYRLSYSKLIPRTGTNLTLATYRFSTQGYYDLATAMMTKDLLARGYAEQRLKRSKSRYTLTASQSLPAGLGQFYSSASLQNYWNSKDTDKQFQVGYSNSWNSVTYGLNVNRTYTWYGKSDTSWLLSLSFPLGTAGDTHVPSARLETGRNNDGSWSEAASLSGTAGEDNQYNYGVTARNTSGATGSSLYVNGQWRTPYTYLNGSSSVGNHYQSQSFGANGSVILHSGGATLSPYTSDTWALIEARGAEGARVSSYPGIRIDNAGYAAVPYLNAYELNEVAIDPKDATNNVGFESTSRKVAPYAGAIVKVQYHTQTGVPVLISARWKGEPAPFGADINNEKGNYIATVGQAGQIFVRLEPGTHILKLKAGHQGECKMKVIVSEEDSAINMKKEVLECY